MRQLTVNKKGQVGLDLTKKVMVSLMVLAVTAIAVILALVSLDDSGIFTANSLADNQSNFIVGNVTSAAADFFSNAGTFFSIIVAVVIILLVAIILAVVSRFGSGSNSAI